MIKETIVVEGKDDIANVKRAVDCEMICTNGLSFGKDLIEKLKKINDLTGIIILTDPDYAGKKIRARIKREIPTAGIKVSSKNPFTASVAIVPGEYWLTASE